MPVADLVALLGAGGAGGRAGAASKAAPARVVRLSLPSRRYAIEPRLDGLAVEGLGTEALIAASPLPACARSPRGRRSGGAVRRLAAEGGDRRRGPALPRACRLRPRRDGRGLVERAARGRRAPARREHAVAAARQAALRRRRAQRRAQGARAAVCGRARPHPRQGPGAAALPRRSRPGATASAAPKPRRCTTSASAPRRSTPPRRCGWPACCAIPRLELERAAHAFDPARLTAIAGALRPLPRWRREDLQLELGEWQPPPVVTRAAAGRAPRLRRGLRAAVRSPGPLERTPDAPRHRPRSPSPSRPRGAGARRHPRPRRLRLQRLPAPRRRRQGGVVGGAEPVPAPRRPDSEPRRPRSRARPTSSRRR